MYGNVKLISTSSFIILTPIPNKKAHEQLELVHKTLITRTSFWINLKVILDFVFVFFI
jgi:hypothetical protein